VDSRLVSLASVRSELGTDRMTGVSPATLLPFRRTRTSRIAFWIVALDLSWMLALPNLRGFAPEKDGSRMGHLRQAYRNANSTSLHHPTIP
jgi:hypothetical protein